MGKKGRGKQGDLGKALLRDRFGVNRSKRGAKEGSLLHTSDMNDGYQWDRLNLSSVTEESSFQEFLSTAQLAGTEFHAEKLNIKYVNPQSEIGILSESERSALLEVHKSNQSLLKIPRRPRWNAQTSAHELQTREKEDFLEWRRQLALLQEAQELTMTPYEKNLEFWRQLWRVVERSDIVVQIVDARNPLLFRCEDLEKYVKEIDEDKRNIILVNKADFLTLEQRQVWADYFTDVGVRIAFFSATEAAESIKSQLPPGELVKNRKRRSSRISEGLGEDVDDEEDDEEGEDDEDDDEESSYCSDFASSSEYESATEDLSDRKPQEDGEKGDDDGGSMILERNSPELLCRDRLIEFFKAIGKGMKKYTEGVTTVGLVGYPNVGKSSTINAILMDKKVSVSATPGKTKHFQTLFVDKELLLCDCPGLVMPSFVCTKAEMVLNGILPIDQLRDHVPSVTLLARLIPRHVLEDTYGIMIPKPIDGEDPERAPTAEELLNTYGYNRGFMTQNGQPDNPRSARYVLKDFVNGKLLYPVAPPTINQGDFHTFPPRRKSISETRVLPPRQIRASRGVTVTNEDLDRNFFQANNSGVHVKGLPGSAKINPENLGAKPWKKMNKHGNKKKREKTRRLFAHLDQH
ncbi:large subunit GTPase 1 homolog [Diachasma alloeum]|uniref:large subunit GTPase 1 homolog n=1 Tax=Diachasma alloeum TaxID=454923 RepID=UPI0007382354|nr:large subunit GTPase 1 homolog [Diachasma alloeum]